MITALREKDHVSAADEQNQLTRLVKLGANGSAARPLCLSTYRILFPANMIILKSKLISSSALEDVRICPNLTKSMRLFFGMSLEVYSSS